jgi:hypothetical protein
MPRPPKYIPKKVLKEVVRRREKTIFDDVYTLLKQGAPYGFIGKFLKGKYDLGFDSRRKVSIYVRRLVSKYAPNCIICGNPRHHSGKFTLFCKYHLDQNVILEKRTREFWRLALMKDMKENKEYWNGSLGTHGDLTDKVLGLDASRSNTLGTSNIGPHRQKNVKREAEIVSKEFDRIGLKHEKKDE